MTEPKSVIASGTSNLIASANAATIVPIKPEINDAAEVDAIDASANQMIELLKDSGSGLRAVAKVGNIGADTQIQLSGKSQLLQNRLKPLFTGTGLQQEGDLYKGLQNLRREVDLINPKVLIQRRQGGWVGKALSMVPGIGKVLGDIAVQYDSAQQVIDAIINGLIAAKGALLADNEELAEISEKVDVWIPEIQRKAYLAELVFTKLREVQDSELSLRSREAKAALMDRLINRIQDLRTMEAMFKMLGVTIQTTFNGNNDLSDTIDRAATITRGLLVVGLSNAQALARQKRTIKVVQQNKASNEQLVVAIAEVAGMGAVEIAKLMNDPAISITAMQTAHDTIVGYLDEADKIKSERLQKAEQALPQLATMSESLDKRLQSLRAVAELPENTEK